MTEPRGLECRRLQSHIFPTMHFSEATVQVVAAMTLTPKNGDLGCDGNTDGTVPEGQSKVHEKW